MARPIVTEEAPFEVAQVEAVGGPSGAARAFEQLEARMADLRGAKMYGVLYRGDPEQYFACLRLAGRESDDLGLDRGTVPGGMYGRQLVRNWNSRIAEIPRIFDQLHSGVVDAGFTIDGTRPSIEFYRRIDELMIMVPVDAPPGPG